MKYPLSLDIGEGKAIIYDSEGKKISEMDDFIVGDVFKIVNKANEHDELVDVLKRQSDLILDLQAQNRDYVKVINDLLFNLNHPMHIKELTESVENARKLLEKAEKVME